MALTKISTAMISQSAAAVDLNVDAGTFYVDTTNNRVGVGGKTDPDTPLHVIGTVTATLFAGSGASLTNIPNSALTNSSITINSTATSLGGSITLTTANIAENTNLYYTNARADARIAAADTDDLSEGSSNLYYTDARVDARVSGGSLGNITTTGYIRGPATFTLDPAAHGDNTGTVVIAGNLQVDGVTTTINSTTLTVDDKNITLASGSANAAAASGAGFTVDIGSGTNPAITYDGTNDEWDFNKDINVTGSVTAAGGTLTDQLLINKDDTGTALRVLGGSGGVYLAEFTRDVGGTGTVAINANGADPQIQFASAGNTFALGVNSNTFEISDNTHIGTNTRFAITNTGNVGIGTTVPSQPLEVAGNIQATGSRLIAALYDSNHYMRIEGNSSGGVLKGTDGGVVTTLVRTYGDSYFTGGKVGIGTTAPAAKLHISGNSDVSDEDCMLIIDDVDGSAGSRIPAIMFRSNTGGTVTNQGRIRGTDTQGMILSGSSALGKDLVVQSSMIGIGTPSNTTFDSNITAYHAPTGSSIKSLLKLWVNTSDNSGNRGGAIEWVGSGDKTAVGSKIAATRVGAGAFMDLRFYTGRNTDSDHEKMRITDAGKVGIGTDSPFAKSHIKDTGWSSAAPYGTVQLIEGNDVNDANWGHLVITDTTTTNGNGGAISFATGASTALNPFSGIKGVSEGASWGGIGFYSRPQSGTATRRMTITSSGNVGIGTTAPLGKLSVGAGSINDAGLPVQISTGADGTQAWYAVNRNGGYGALFGYSASSTYKGLVLRNVVSAGTANADGISFMTNNTSMRMHITGAGNVGIGNTDPNLPLTVTSNSGANAIAIRARSADDYGFIQFYNHAGTALRGQIFNHNGAIGISTSTTGTARLHIDTAGNVGIGTDSPQRNLDVRHALNIFGSGGYTELMLRGRAGTAQNLGAFHWSIRGDVGGNNDDLMLLRFTGGNSPSYAGTSMHIRNDNGYVGIGTNTGQPNSPLHIKSAGTGNVLYVESSDGHHLGGFYQESDTRAAFNVRDASGSVKVNLDAGGNSWFTGGNLGIGTTSPDYLLALESTATGLTHNLKLNKSSTTGDYAEIAFQLWSGAGTGLNTFGGSGTSRPSVVLRAVNEATNSAAGAFVVGTFTGGASNSTLTEKFRIASDGKVGIGTTIPNNKLQIGSVGSSNYGGNEFVIGDGTRVFATYLNTSTDAVEFYTTRKFAFLPSGSGSTGNVGIGTSAPAYKLDISGTSNDLTPLIRGTASNTPSGAFNWATEFIAPNLANDRRFTHIWGKARTTYGMAHISYLPKSTASESYLALGLWGANDILNVLGNGNVGIGTNNPAHPFHITKELAGYQAYFNNDNGSAQGIKVRIKSNDSGNFNMLELVSASTGSDVTAMVVRDDGNVGIGTTAPSNLLSLKGRGNNWNTSPAMKLWDSQYSKGWYVGTAHNQAEGDYYIRSVTSESAYPVAANQQFTITQGGNVGIGTIAPSYPLHIQTNDGTTNSTVGNILITNLSTGTTVPGFGGHIQFQAERNNGVNQNIGKIAFQSEVNAGTNISAGLRLYTSSAGTMTEKGRISWDGMWFVNGVRNYYQKLTIVNNQSYTFDVPIEATGSGHTVYYECMYNHFGNDTYGARRMGFFSFRSLSNSTSADHVVHNGGNSTNAGAWSVSMVGAGTSTPMMRFTKSAGSYGGTGQGYIHVRGGLPV